MTEHERAVIEAATAYVTTIQQDAVSEGDLVLKARRVVDTLHALIDAVSAASPIAAANARMMRGED